MSLANTSSIIPLCRHCRCESCVRSVLFFCYRCDPVSYTLLHRNTLFCRVSEGNSTGYFAFAFAHFLSFIYKASLHATCTKFFCPSLLKLESERRWSCSSRFTTTAYSDIKGNMHVKPIFDIRSMECCCCHVQSRPLREAEESV
jgi:hypothetical protein